MSRIEGATNQRGFTLVEIVLIISVLGIVSAIGVMYSGDSMGDSRENAVEAAAEQSVSSAQSAIGKGKDPVNAIENNANIRGDISVDLVSDPHSVIGEVCAEASWAEHGHTFKSGPGCEIEEFEPPQPPPPESEPDLPIVLAPLLVSAGPDASQHFTNNWTLQGSSADLYVESDFHCNSQSRFEGSVVILGDAYMTNDCTVEGDLWVGGELTINSNPVIHGNVWSEGDVSFQSTAYVGGDITTEGSFSSNDGRTIEQLKNGGSLDGEVFQNTDVESPPVFEFPVLNTPEHSTAWSDWMQEQAAMYEGAENNDVGRGSGCTIATGSNWSLPGDIVVNEETFVDATESNNCSRISFGQGGEITLYDDLTVYMNSFDSPNGMNVVSGDGRNYELNMIVPVDGDEANPMCSSGGNINIGSNSTFDSDINVTLYTESEVSINGTTAFTGSVYSACTRANGHVTVSYER